MPSPRSLILVPILVALLAGCGSSGGSSGQPSGAAPAGQATAAPVAPTADVAVEPSSEAAEPRPADAAPAGAGVPEIAEGAWGAGTATVEISGDVSATVKGSMPAGIGYSAGGFTSFTFTDADGASVINVALSPTEQSGFAVTSTPSNVSTAGTWGVDGCTIDVTRNDGSGVAGSFTCSRIPAIAITEAKAYTVDLKGSFEVAR